MAEEKLNVVSGTSESPQSTRHLQAAEWVRRCHTTATGAFASRKYLCVIRPSVDAGIIRYHHHRTDASPARAEIRHLDFLAEEFLTACPAPGWIQRLRKWFGH